MEQAGLIYKHETYQIIGAAMKVHRELGPGFTEKVYQEALAIEMKEQGIPFAREVTLHAAYKGITLEGTFVPDFICYDKIIVELKAKLSLLLNFGEISLTHERFPVG